MLLTALVCLLAFVVLSDRKGAWSWLPHQERLGLVRVTGPITDASEILSALHDLAQDESVRAVLVRIDSPGGAVGASQEIYQAIQKMNKPVIASMGNVAASGGYYIAAACDMIFAAPGTITGSIGVITTIPNLGGLLDKLGIKIEVLTSGPLKAAGQSNRPLNPQEKALLENVVQDLHRQFVSHVAAGRKMEEEEVARLADGRIYTGSQALEARLVDQLGNYYDAMHRAIQMGNFSGKDPEIFCPQDEGLGFWDIINRQGAQLFWQQISSLFYSFAQPSFTMPPWGSASQP
jgi:protease-4